MSFQLTVNTARRQLASTSTTITGRRRLQSASDIHIDLLAQSLANVFATSSLDQITAEHIAAAVSADDASTLDVVVSVPTGVSTGDVEAVVVAASFEAAVLLEYLSVVDDAGRDAGSLESFAASSVVVVDGIFTAPSPPPSPSPPPPSTPTLGDAGGDEGTDTVAEGTESAITTSSTDNSWVAAVVVCLFLFVCVPLGIAVYARSNYPGREGAWWRLKTTHSNVAMPLRYINAEVRADMQAQLAGGKRGGQALLHALGSSVEDAARVADEPLSTEDVALEQADIAKALERRVLRVHNVDEDIDAPVEP